VIPWLEAYSLPLQALRLAILALDSIAPFSFLWSLLAFVLYPTPPLVVLFGFLPADSLDTLYAFDRPLQLVTVWCAVESAWFCIHWIGRTLVARGWWDLRGPREKIGSEERWRLWVKMVESSKNPWSWLGGMFLVPRARRAPRGMTDPAITKVKMQDVGRTNVEECESFTRVDGARELTTAQHSVVAHFLFGTSLRSIKPKSLERGE
jgi:hypothetical protein